MSDRDARTAGEVWKPVEELRQRDRSALTPQERFLATAARERAREKVGALARSSGLPPSPVVITAALPEIRAAVVGLLNALSADLDFTPTHRDHIARLTFLLSIRPGFEESYQ